jgi:hypothetical protein
MWRPIKEYEERRVNEMHTEGKNDPKIRFIQCNKILKHNIMEYDVLHSLYGVEVSEHRTLICVFEI